MSQLCGRREGDRRCLRPEVELEVTESSTDEAPVGVRLCGPCGWNLTRRQLVTTVPVP